MEDPVVILKSQSKSNVDNNRIVLFGEVIENNKPILVAMELNPAENAKQNVDKIYKVASAYGKKNINTIQKWLNKEENILYVDSNKKRTTKWLNGLGLQLPVPSNNSGSSDMSISQYGKNVKPSINFSSYLFLINIIKYHTK